MNKLVVISGGFHPFHAGHMALYTAAKEAFPDAQIVIGATNAQKDRPFPFKIKQKLAQVSGVPPKDFVEVSRQFSAEDPAIASRVKNPNDTILIFARSEKDKNEPPMPAKPDPVTGKLPLVTRGPNKGKPISNYLQYFAGNEDNLQPMTQHAYMAYLPTVEFGPGITSATEIRNAWPKLNEKRKLAMVMSLYPATAKNTKLAQNVVKIYDSVMGEELAEEVNPEVTSDDYTEPSQNVRMGDFVFNARTFTSALGSPNVKGLQIRAYDPKNLKSSIGSADFIVKKDKKGNQWLESDDTEVNDEYRGKGVAAMMYAFAKALGNDIKRSPYQSKAGSNMWNKWGSDAENLVKEQGVAEGFPQPGESSGKAKQFNPNAKVQTREMTLDQILATVKGIPYVNNVVDDWNAKDYSWGVTKKVIEYAQYLQKNPQSVANLPPLVVIDGQLNDGAHRLSAINLLQKRMDPKNPLWKQVKLKVKFGKSTDIAPEQVVAEGLHPMVIDDVKKFAKYEEDPLEKFSNP